MLQIQRVHIESLVQTAAVPNPEKYDFKCKSPLRRYDS